MRFKYLEWGYWRCWSWGSWGWRRDGSDGWELRIGPFFWYRESRESLASGTNCEHDDTGTIFEQRHL